MNRPRLPNRKWLRLQEATSFAFYGVAYTVRVDSLTDLIKLDERLADLRYPSIYGQIDDDSQRDFAETQFNKHLSEAGLAGNVHFQSQGNDVPHWQFNDVREFLHQHMSDTIPASRSHPEIHDVMVERASFLTWLAVTYPGLNFDKDASAITAPSPNGCGENELSTGHATANVETQCRSWLNAQMKAAPDQRPQPKMDFYRQAAKEFEGLGRPNGVKPSRMFDRAWVAAMTETGAKWDQPGATCKNPRTNNPRTK